MYAVKNVALLKIKSIRIDRKRTNASAVQQQIGGNGIYLLKKHYCK